MTKSTKSKKGINLLLGSTGAVLAGWLLNKFGKDKAKQLYSDVSDKVKETQNKWYTDGEKRAQDIANIKRDVNSKLK